MNKVKVWDLPTRLFHWILVIAFVAMFYTGDQGGDWLSYHIKGGVVLAGLILFRLIWGVIGSDTARFSQFIKGPRGIKRYLNGEVSESEQPGHNPVGALMIVALLIMLIVQITTGLLASDIDGYTYDGPLAKFIDSDLSEQLTVIHGFSFYILAALIVLHIAAVVVYQVIKKQNLVRPMILGYKSLSYPLPTLKFKSTLLAAIIFIACLGALFGLVSYLESEVFSALSD